MKILSITAIFAGFPIGGPQFIVISMWMALAFVIANQVVPLSFAADPNTCEQALRPAITKPISSAELKTELDILNSANHLVTFDPTKDIQFISLASQYQTFSQLLIDDQGDFYVFRKLNGPYDPATRGTYSNMEGHFSYSMNPYITILWDGGGRVGFDPTKSHIIVSRLRLVPGRKDFFYPTFSRDAPDAFSTTNLPNRGRYRPLTGASRLSDDAFYDELDVPFADENVIVDLPESVYRSVLSDVSRTADLQHGGTPFKQVDFIKKLLRASHR